MKIKHTVQTEISNSVRVKQLSSMFDVPPRKRESLSWNVNLPIETGDNEKHDWNVGLIVGPSGSGKSIIARHVFGKSVDKKFRWPHKSVIDDFAQKNSVADIANICQAVGFNTIPAWLRPYKVLSTGEQFRVSIARRLLEQKDPIVVDEFTSVVDRQVAKIGSHAIQKFVRKNKRKFVAVTCHHDITDWLQPDWILEMPTGKFKRRRLRQRPKLDVTIARVPHSYWNLFAPFHYLTATLHPAAKCYGLFVNGNIASFCGVMQSVGKKSTTKKTIYRVSRVVTLPDYQGIGLAFVLTEFIGSCFKALGINFHNNPAHYAYIRACDKSEMWEMRTKPGSLKTPQGYLKRNKPMNDKYLQKLSTQQGSRPCATFRYAGPPADPDLAHKMIIEKPNFPKPKPTAYQRVMKMLKSKKRKRLHHGEHGGHRAEKKSP